MKKKRYQDQEKTIGLEELIGEISSFYSTIDKALDSHIKRGISEHGKISCHSCTEPACCHQKTEVTITEVLPIALHLKKEGKDTPEFRQMLRSIGHEMEGSDRSAWLNQYRPCVFLDNKRCSIYALRPMRCRSYWVISPAELCRPPAKRSVKIIDDTPAMEETLRFTHEVHSLLGLKENQMRILRGSLPRVLLIVLEAWDSSDYKRAITHQAWPSARALEEGWTDGDNPFSKGPNGGPL